MNYLNILFAAAIIVAAIIMAIMTGGLLLPVSMPLTAYSLKLLGIEP
jgi:hypothetical protein